MSNRDIYYLGDDLYVPVPGGDHDRVRLPRVAGDLLRGNGVVALGDSITASNSDNSSGTAGGSSWFTLACLFTDNRIRHTRNAGVSGDTTTLALARVYADVVAYEPAACIVLLGTNDLGNGVPLATIKANLTSIYERLRKYGITPIACTLTPRTSSLSDLVKINAWITDYAAQNGLVCVDLYRVTADPSTGQWLSGYDLDGLHPNNAGAKLIANEVARVVAPMLPETLPYLASYKSDGQNLITNGLFIGDANSDGVADTWSLSGSGTYTKSLGTDAAVKGNYQRIQVTAQGAPVLAANLGAQTAGHVIAFSGMIRTTGLESGGLDVDVRLRCDPSGGYVGPIRQLKTDVDWHRFFYVRTLPVGTTGLTAQITASATGTGTVDVAQLTALDLTALGLV